MSKKVLFYMILDLIGIGIALISRYLLCNTFSSISDPLLQSALILAVNVIFTVVCLFILFFFLLYWWSDRKWTKIKRKFKKHS